MIHVASVSGSLRPRIESELTPDAVVHALLLDSLQLPAIMPCTLSLQCVISQLQLPELAAHGYPVR